MKLLRSWPPKIPAGRSFVVDATEKLVIDGYDYRPLADVDDDILLIEWDVAVDRDGLEYFAAAAQEDRSRVIVAPYRLYVTTSRGNPLPKPVWAHRTTDGHHVDTGDPVCALFGMGLIYLPRRVIAAFTAEWRGHFSDGALSGWHRRHVTDAVPILWDVRPQHLHYPIAGLGLGSAKTPTVHPWMTRVDRSETADADYAAAEQAGDGMVAALLRERAGFKLRGMFDRIAAVDEQLALRGYFDEEK